MLDGLDSEIVFIALLHRAVFAVLVDTNYVIHAAAMPRNTNHHRLRRLSRFRRE